MSLMTFKFCNLNANKIILCITINIYIYFLSNNSTYYLIGAETDTN